MYNHFLMSKIEVAVVLDVSDIYFRFTSYSQRFTDDKQFTRIMSKPTMVVSLLSKQLQGLHTSYLLLVYFFSQKCIFFKPYVLYMNSIFSDSDRKSISQGTGYVMHVCLYRYHCYYKITMVMSRIDAKFSIFFQSVTLVIKQM